MSFSIASDKRKKSLNLFDLITYIKETHHVFARSQLYRIATLLVEIEKDGTAAILEIKHCYNKLQADLLPHLIKEEHILFPYIAELSKGSSALTHSGFGSIFTTICTMVSEHAMVKILLSTLRKLTDDYHPPASCAPNITALYFALSELDFHLIEHIHWEDDVLFLHALILESKVLI